MMAKYFDWHSKFGWPEIGAIAGAILATSLSVASWLESRAARLDAQQARAEALASVSVDESLTAVDARDVKTDGTGRFVWYVRYNFTNTGERPASLLGAWNRAPYPIVLAMRDGAIVDAEISVSIHAGEHLEWNDVENDPDFFTKNRPTSWEMLGSLNQEIPGGQSRSLALIYVVDNPETPTDAYLINHRFVFSNGHEHPVDHFLQLNGSAQPKKAG